jgi:broad specificity phosphatase PhoE/plasmid maintenance system antidote protein VapI
LKDKKTREQIGKKIKKLRVNKGFSQEEIASRLHIPRPSVSQIEHGKRDISVIELARLSEVFSLSPDEIIKTPFNEKTSDDNEDKVRKIYFMRHGEAFDDIFDQYGGWANPDLSSKGVSRAHQTAENLKKKHLNFDIIFTSPLNRAHQKAEILGQELNVETKVLQYLKERNTYGLLCGMNKEVSRHKYPELVNAYQNDKYVLGSERYEDFVDRLRLLINYLRESKHKQIACVTHGKLITALIQKYLEMTPDNLEDDCMLVVGIEDDEIYYIQSEGITFTR